MNFETAYKQRFIILRTFSNFLLISGIFFLFFSLGPTLKIELWYKIKEFKGLTFTLDPQKGKISPQEVSPFGLLLSQYPPIKVEPVSRDFSLVVERIGVNAPVVADVEVGQRGVYLEALKRGVAHAAGSVKPGKIGNTYLFAHSALDFWNFGKYATVFTLLNKLQNDDRIVLFYGGQRYDYLVFNKEVVRGFNTTPLTRTFSTPVLTLQTCDPPGTALNRLIVTARLVKVGN